MRFNGSTWTGSAPSPPTRCRRGNDWQPVRPPPSSPRWSQGFCTTATARPTSIPCFRCRRPCRKAAGRRQRKRLVLISRSAESSLDRGKLGRGGRTVKSQSRRDSPKKPLGASRSFPGKFPAASLRSGEQCYTAPIVRRSDGRVSCRCFVSLRSYRCSHVGEGTHGQDTHSAQPSR